VVELFIDDERNPPKREGVVYDVVRSSSAALGKLNDPERHYDAIWFDHDLGGDDTTIPVLDRLSEMAFNGNPYPVSVIYVHTANPVGRKTIISSLTRWGYSYKISNYYMQ